MDLRERLQRLGVQKGVRHLQVPPLEPPRGLNIEQVIPGQLVETEHGRFFLAEEIYPLQHCHGDWPLAAALEQAAADLFPLARDVSLEKLDLKKVIFLDTETTGLAGGTGTYAFLVGVGYFEDGAFRLRQFFMRDYSDELPMLSELARFLHRFSALVSFNGRAFDWPLLETRFVMTRLPAPLCGAPHLDLLHLARRLWRVRLPSCALSSLEQHILGVQRTGQDVPGYLVPEIYFRYLQNGDARPMSRVFYHNAQDILSLVTLSAYLGRIGNDPFNGPLIHGVDFYSLGRLFESSQDFEAAIRAYQHALAHQLSEDIRQAVVFCLSSLYKRLGERDKAVSLWDSMLGTGQLYPYIELAKHYEHWCRDYVRAEALVCEALSLVHTTSDQNKAQILPEIEHRLQRLRRKMKGASSVSREQVRALAEDTTSKGKDADKGRSSCPD